jgi:hypothetical protein
MIEAVIQALIYICVLALVIYLIIWVLQSVANIALPAKVIQIIWIIFALVCLLILVRLLLPHSGKILGAVLPVLA